MSLEHEGDGPGTTDDAGLLGVEERETLGDVVALTRVRAEIADGWTAGIEVVGSGADLGEAVVLEKPASGRCIRLRSRRLTEPAGAVEWRERPRRGTASRRVRTVDGLERAVRAAVTRTHQSPD